MTVFLKDELNLLELIKTSSQYLDEKHDFIFEPHLTLKQKSYSYSDLILFINCDAENPDFIKDEAGKFRFISKDVFLIKENNDSVCYFKNRSNTLLLETSPYYWPISNNDEFSILIKFKPLVSLKDQILFDWSTYTEDDIKTFRVSLYKDQIQINLSNILKIEKKYKNYILNIDDVVFNSWNHFFITFSNDKKIIKIYLNNEIKKIINLPERMVLDFNSIHIAPIRIGYKFSGFLDEVLILNKYYDEPVNKRNYDKIKVSLNSGRIYQNIKTIVSPPIQISKNTHKIHLNWNINQPSGTILKIYYRFSEHLNQLHISSWKEMNLTPKTFVFERNILSQYLQFRIDMLHDSDGKESPKIYSLYLKQEKMNPPPAVTGLRIIKELSNENQICLEWQKLPDEIIEEYGGYKIHIGIHPESSEIVLDKIYKDNQWIEINKKNLDFPLTKEEETLQKLRPIYWNRYKNTHIRIILTKDILEHYANKRLEKNDLAINRIKLIFEKDIIYYFRVSSYIYDINNYSTLSKAVQYSF